MTVRGFNICCISYAADGTGDNMLRTAAKRMGMLGASATNTNALTMKMETMTLIGYSR